LPIDKFSRLALTQEVQKIGQDHPASVHEPAKHMGLFERWILALPWASLRVGQACSALR
jgi:hypothetical protein